MLEPIDASFGAAFGEDAPGGAATGFATTGFGMLSVDGALAAVLAFGVDPRALTVDTGALEPAVTTDFAANTGVGFFATTVFGAGAEDENAVLGNAGGALGGAAKDVTALVIVLTRAE